MFSSLFTKSFSKILDRPYSGLSRDDLLVYYKIMVRPIIEYACPVWHAGLTSGKGDLLEQIQKRAIRIIYLDSRYIDALESAHMQLLSVCRESELK